MSDMNRDSGKTLSRIRRSLPMALLRAREVVMDRFRPLLQEHGITEQQWRVLRVLQENSPQDATELAQNANVLGPSLTRIIKTLQAKGMIKTEKGRMDGRRVTISLTRTGEDFIKAIAPGSTAIYSEIEMRLGRERIDSLLDELDAVISTLSKKP